MNRSNCSLQCPSLPVFASICSLAICILYKAFDIFASDFSRVFWQLRELNCYNDVINIGSGQSYTINEIIGYIKIILPQTEWVYQDEKIFDTRHSYFSIEKLKSKTNFINTEIVRAIESTYSWEKNKLTKL